MVNDDGGNGCYKHWDCGGGFDTCEYNHDGVLAGFPVKDIICDRKLFEASCHNNDCSCNDEFEKVCNNGMPVKEFVVSKPDVKDWKQAELDAKAVEWFNNQADLAEKDERISVLGNRVAALLSEADECDELSASQMAINAQLEKENRLLRDELVELQESFDDLILKFDLQRGRTQELESKNAELMTQFAALDADYDQLKVDNEANVGNLAKIVNMYNNLQDVSTGVMGREMLYKIKIAKLKYLSLIHI